MDWALFCQIEVIMLTVGIVISFVLSVWQNAKDNSFFKRVGAIGEVIKEYGKSVTESKNEAQSKLISDVVNAINAKQKKEQK